MSDFETLVYEKKNNIGYVTLNRPQVLNVYNIQMRDELHQVLGAIRDDIDMKVVILSGAGNKAFCAGARIGEVSLVLRYDLKEGQSKMKKIQTILKYFRLMARGRRRIVRLQRV